MDQVTSPAVAAAVENVVAKLVGGKINSGSAICELMSALDEKGFRDLSDNGDWLNDVLDLNSSLRSGWSNYNGGLHAAILDQWPAQEFFRAFPRTVHRDWSSRWVKLGGRIYDGKMIALKDDPIWCALSDFSLPFPPLAVGSGMYVRDVDRRTAINLGLIDRDRRVSPKKVPPPTLILN